MKTLSSSFRPPNDLRKTDEGEITPANSTPQSSLLRAANTTNPLSTSTFQNLRSAPSSGVGKRRSPAPNSFKATVESMTMVMDTDNSGAHLKINIPLSNIPSTPGLPRSLFESVAAIHLGPPIQEKGAAIQWSVEGEGENAVLKLDIDRARVQALMVAPNLIIETQPGTKSGWVRLVVDTQTIHLDTSLPERARLEENLKEYERAVKMDQKFIAQLEHQAESFENYVTSRPILSKEVKSYTQLVSEQSSKLTDAQQKHRSMGKKLDSHLNTLSDSELLIVAKYATTRDYGDGDWPDLSFLNGLAKTRDGSTNVRQKISDFMGRHATQEHIREGVAVFHGAKAGVQSALWQQTSKDVERLPKVVKNYLDLQAQHLERVQEKFTVQLPKQLEQQREALVQAEDRVAGARKTLDELGPVIHTKKNIVQIKPW